MQPDATQESFDLDHFLAWLHHNRKPVAIVGTIVVVAAIAVALFNWNKSQKALNANKELFALPSLIGSTNRADVSAQNFEKIANEYPNTKVAERAEIIAAGILFTDGKYAEAEKKFTQILNAHEDLALQAEAALGIAAALEAQNKIPEATAKYQEVVLKYPTSNVISPAKLTLARLLETQNKPEEAVKLYDELMRSNMRFDPWAAEARERRELLLQKFPDLKNKLNATTPAAATNSVVPGNAPTK